MSQTQTKHPVSPDPKYQDVIVGKFINYLMKNGKKSLAQRILYEALENLDKKSNNKGLEMFHQALENVGPILEVRSKRIGGANYQVPIEVTKERRNTLAMRWILEAARKRKGKNMANRLTEEFSEAVNGVGAAVKKKEDTHRMAEANRAFAHFAKM